MGTAAIFDSHHSLASPIAKSKRKSNPHRPSPTPVKARQFSPSPPLHGKPGRKISSNPARAGRRYQTGEDVDSRHGFVLKYPTRNLVMEEVTILKRGEEMKTAAPAFDFKAEKKQGSDDLDDLKLCTTERLGLDTEILPKQNRLIESVYAGSGFVESPSPSSLPIPASFFAKKDEMGRTDLATKGLRYLLRLDVP